MSAAILSNVALCPDKQVGKLATLVLIGGNSWCFVRFNIFQYLSTFFTISGKWTVDNTAKLLLCNYIHKVVDSNKRITLQLETEYTDRLGFEAETPEVEAEEDEDTHTNEDATSPGRGQHHGHVYAERQTRHGERARAYATGSS